VGVTKAEVVPIRAVDEFSVIHDAIRETQRDLELARTAAGGRISRDERLPLQTTLLRYQRELGERFAELRNMGKYSESDLTARRLGISIHKVDRYVRVAAIPEDQFERQLLEWQELPGKWPGLDGMLGTSRREARKKKQKVKKVTTDANDVQQHSLALMEAFEIIAAIDMPPEKFVAALDDVSRDSLAEYVQSGEAWLVEFMAAWKKKVKR